jgi:hypothetical protein
MPRRTLLSPRMRSLCLFAALAAALIVPAVDGRPPARLSADQLRRLPVTGDGRRILTQHARLSEPFISPRPCPEIGCSGDGIQDFTDISYNVVAFDTIRVEVYIDTVEIVELPFRGTIQGIERRAPGDTITIPRFDGVIRGSSSSIALPDGQYHIIVRAYDDTNRVESDTLGLTIDRQRPVIRSVAPLAGITSYRNGETIVLTVEADAPGYTVTGNFAAIDTDPGDTQTIDLGNGRYELRHTLSSSNGKVDAANLLIPIRVTDRSGNFTNYNSLRLCLSNAPPRFLGARTVNAPEGAYRNESLIQIETTWDSPDTLLTILADFRGLDSAYDSTMYVTSRLSGNRYLSSYRLSEANIRPDGTYLVPITARDRGCGASPMTTIAIALDTQGGAQPAFEDPPAGVRSAGYTLRGTAEGSNRVIIVRNDVLVDTFAVDAEGRFAAAVTLVPGDNRFTAEGLDPAGNKTVRSPAVTIILVTGGFVSIPVPFRPGDILEVGASRAARGLRVEFWTLAGDLARVLTSDTANDVYRVAWDGRDAAGERLNSGPLIVIIRTDFVDGGGETERRAIVLTAGPGAP